MKLNIKFLFLIIFIKSTFCSDSLDLLDFFKDFSSEIEIETGIDVFNLLKELSTISNEKNISQVGFKLNEIFLNFIAGKNIERFLNLIPEIINKSIFNEKEKKYNENDSSLFSKYPYAAISTEYKNLSSLNIAGDVHSSYDAFGLIYKFILNAKNGEYLIFAGDYIDRDLDYNCYSSIFYLILTGALNAFFISQKDLLSEKFSGQTPIIIFNRGNHESINYVGKKITLTIDKLINKSKTENLLKKYFKDSYFLGTIINVEKNNVEKKKATFVINHSCALELFENPIDCSKLPKNQISFLNVNISHPNSKKNLKHKINNVLNVQSKFYNFFNDTNTWNTPINLLGDPNKINEVDKCGRINTKIKDSKKIFKSNFLNPGKLKFIICGHSHSENTYSLYKQCEKKCFCALPNDSNKYNGKFYQYNFINTFENKNFIFKNEIPLKTLSNKNIFGLFMPPLFKNMFGESLCSQNNDKDLKFEDLTSFIYQIKKDKNNNLIVRSIKLIDLFLKNAKS
jgi:hypothetical protein